jgi:hypothetical protein
MDWKNKALRAIAPILSQYRESCRNGSMNRSQLRRELNKVYPFGQRANHPYRVWCAVVNAAIEDVFGAEQTGIEELPLFEDDNN